MTAFGTEERGARAGGSLRVWFYAVGLLGLAIAVASIADMFSARPNDGIVPVPYRTGGIEVRMVAPGGAAEKAGIAAGGGILGLRNPPFHPLADAPSPPTPRGTGAATGSGRPVRTSSAAARAPRPRRPRGLPEAAS